jgi:hypothetical protein
MTSEFIGVAKGNTKILVLLATAASLYPLAPHTLAQEPIRVGTNEVLVPVVVADKEQLRLSRQGGPFPLKEDPAEIRDLTAADFHIFEDGKEQPIRSVYYDITPDDFDFRDNRGYHSEFVGEGGGRWSTREWPPWIIAEHMESHHYVIAYIPRESPEMC